MTKYFGSVLLLKNFKILDKSSPSSIPAQRSAKQVSLICALGVEEAPMKPVRLSPVEVSLSPQAVFLPRSHLSSAARLVMQLHAGKKGPLKLTPAERMLTPKTGNQLQILDSQVRVAP